MKNFKIIYGDNSTQIQKRAIEHLSKIIHNATGLYPICERFSNNKNDDFVCFYLGTKSNNEYILKNSKCTLTESESYCIDISNLTAIIEGYDDAGVLYGVIDLYNKYFVKYSYYGPDENAENFLRVHEKLFDYYVVSAPSIKTRGLWTWGHVIYDYKGYIDNMMALKLNSVIIWNDYVPLNAKEIVEYAHARNIKVIWGFSWLWDTDCKIFDMVNTKEKSLEIFNKYQTEYANLEGDGIYFQTFTELKVDSVNGVLIADAATKFVNETAGMFLEKYPNLLLQFGLHATSVNEKLEYIKKVDNRVEIIWEDCGCFPYSYFPNDIKNLDETIDFTTKIATLRGKNDKFGVVTKGLSYLNWPTFEHLNGVQEIGVSTKNYIENRAYKKIPFWRYIQAHWLANGDVAYKIVKQINELKEGNTKVYALVEDGVFDSHIYYPVALFSEMLWDANSDIKTLQSEVALRDYIKFV